MENLEIAIPIEDEYIKGNLSLVEDSIGLVVFAHGSGSSRHSKRNQYVAQVLNESKISTFLFDLLTPKEEEVDQFTREFRFDIPLLAERLVLVTDWLKNYKNTQYQKLGYFGASTGAAAALIAAAKLQNQISAVVSRGGRPDLAGNFLPNVKAPTLLIVGEEDHEVINLNMIAFSKLECTKEIKLIAGATHLFEEPGTLEQAADVAKDWFVKFLRS